MKKFWDRPRFKVRRGDLFAVCEEVGFGDFALALLDFQFVQADDIFECWKDEKGRYHVEHMERLGWGCGVSPPAELCCPHGECRYGCGVCGSFDPCHDAECAHKCRRVCADSVRLDNTLHK